jgi:HEPN domain-containing protein
MKEKNFKEWIKKAEKDLIAAKHLLSIKPNPPYDIICFHAQQCAEKYIKAFIIYIKKAIAQKIPPKQTYKLSSILSL